MFWLIFSIVLTNCELIGRWTFNSGEELKDTTGNFADLQLSGSASIANGMLDLNGNADVSSGNGVAAYIGNATIGDKTLIAWLKMDSFNAWAGLFFFSCCFYRPFYFLVFFLTKNKHNRFAHFTRYAEW